MASSSNVHADAMQGQESTGFPHGTVALHVTWPGLPVDGYTHEKSHEMHERPQAPAGELSDVEHRFSDSLLLSPAANARDSPPTDNVDVKSELTSSPRIVPSHYNTFRHPHPVAISASRTFNPHTAGQDVPIVNTSARQSTAPRPGPSASLFETSVSSHPYPQHVVTRPSDRLRTSNQVFSSTQDLANHYGLPQILPPPPRTTPRRHTPPAAPSPVTDFSSLSANYLNMLSQKPNNTMAAQNMPMHTVSPTDLSGPALLPQDLGLEQADLDNLVNLISTSPVLSSRSSSSASSSPSMAYRVRFAASPEFRDLNSFEYLTSPQQADPMADFSPDDTPFNNFLNTPLMDSVDEPLLTSPTPWSEMMLFPEQPDYAPIVEKAAPAPATVEQPQATFEDLYTFSPSSPNLDSFPPAPTSLNPQSLYSEPRRPSEAPNAAASSTASSASGSRRKSTATGTRRGLTAEALVPIDAPTQPRNYVTPSQTSRKEVPAVFARKRARSTAFGDEEEDELTLEPLPPNATEKQQIEHKRRQNTIAARKSRKRKLEHQRALEDERDMYKHRAQVWETRAKVLQEVVQMTGGQPIAWNDSELEW